MVGTNVISVCSLRPGPLQHRRSTFATAASPPADQGAPEAACRAAEPPAPHDQGTFHWPVFGENLLVIENCTLVILEAMGTSKVRNPFRG